MELLFPIASSVFLKLNNLRDSMKSVQVLFYNALPRCGHCPDVWSLMLAYLLESKVAMGGISVLVDYLISPERAWEMFLCSGVQARETPLTFSWSLPEISLLLDHLTTREFC